MNHVLGGNGQRLLVIILGAINPAAPVAQQFRGLRLAQFNTLQLSTPPTNYAAVTVPPAQRVGLLCFTPFIGRLPLIWFIVEQVVGWMIRARLNAPAYLAQHVDRQLRQGAG